MLLEISCTLGTKNSGRNRLLWFIELDIEKLGKTICINLVALLQKWWKTEQEKDQTKRMNRREWYLHANSKCDIKESCLRYEILMPFRCMLWAKKRGQPSADLFLYISYLGSFKTSPQRWAVSCWGYFQFVPLVKPLLVSHKGRITHRKSCNDRLNLERFYFGASRHPHLM